MSEPYLIVPSKGGRMSSEPYLVAHLVRGQPAFDIAEQIEIGDEVGWIIPTSGHRAYPYWVTELNNLRCLHPLGDGHNTNYPISEFVPSPPEGHPDHYAPSAAPKGTGLISNLAERLGLVPKPPTITRR